MGLDISAYSEVSAVAGVPRDEAFDQGLLGFYEDEVSLPGFAGMDLHSAYSYAETKEFAMGNFRGVVLFFDTLAELSGFPGNSLDPNYKGPFRPLFQAREWLGPLDCVALLNLLRQCEEVLESSSAQAVLVRHNYLPEDFREYLGRWLEAFTLAAQHGAMNFH